ncbi:hypothetical protein Tco_0640281, partial [Tanacetum coccineum]
DHAPKAMSEARMREIIRDQVTTSTNEFMANINRGAGGAGAGGDGVGGARAGVEAKVTGCTYMTFMKCNPHPFKGTEGAVGLCRALTWWNRRTASMDMDAANWTPWARKYEGTDIDGYTNRFQELALLYPRMVEPEQVKVEQYIRGLSKKQRGGLWNSSQPVTN